MADIPITGVPSSYRVPGAFAEILFAQGPANAASSVRDVCLAMPLLSTGAWTAATKYAVPNEQAAIDGAGVGSPLHRAARKFLRMNTQAKLWALPVTETGGGGAPVAADVDITWVGNASAAGQTSVTVAGEKFTHTFATNDTITEIAAAMVLLINAAEHLPVTAANVAGALTLTARLDGISQGDATVGGILVRAEIDAGVTTTVAPAEAEVGDDTAGAEGATSEATNLATALLAIAATRMYYLVSNGTDTTSYANLASHISTKSAPNPGLRSVGIVAYPHTLAACQTLANARNYERFQIAWQEDADNTPEELAAGVAAIRAKHENTDSAYNFAGYRQTDWNANMLPTDSDADWPTGTEQNDAITDGITPIATDGSGSYIVMSVNTRSKNTSGAVDDFRATETHRVSVADDFTDVRLANWNLNHRGKKLLPDETLADGSVNTNQRNIRGTVRPSQIARDTAADLRDFANAAKLQAVDESIAALRTAIDPTNSSRVEQAVNLHAIDHMHQYTVRIAEVSN